MGRYELYNDAAQTCSECFASIHHYVQVDGVVYCKDDDPNDVSETWLKFDANDDEDPSHAATVEGSDREGYTVAWWNEAVGLITERTFLNLEDAHAWLEDAGYADYTA